MKKPFGMVISILLIAGILAGAAGCKTSTAATTTNNTSASTTSSTTTTATTTATTTTTTNAGYVNSVSATFANGLTLSVGLDGFTYTTGQRVSINIKEQNGLAGDNIIPAENNWAYNQLNLGPCGINGSMYAIAVFKGNYTTSDIASLTPLYFWDYTLIPPCAMSPPVSSYTFKPLSDIVMTQYGQYEASLQTYITGYWTGSPKAALNIFDPGVYTIVAGDEWGNLAAVHFTVTTTKANTTTIPMTTLTDNTITIMDAPGSILKDQQNVPSEVLLKTIEINMSISDKHYYGTWVKADIYPGEPMFLVSGIFQNMHPVNKYITLYALGYDEKGNQVAGTMDCTAICGEIVLQGGTGETGEFTMHLNYNANMKTLRIFANTYAIPPP